MDVQRPSGTARLARLLGAVAAMFLAAGLWAPSALADLGSVGGSLPTSGVVETAGASASEPAAEAEAAVAQTAEPVVSEAGNAVASTSSSATGMAEETPAAPAPTVETTAVTQVAESVEETAAPVQESVAEVAAAAARTTPDVSVEAAPVLETATAPLLDTTRGAVDAVSEVGATTPVVGETLSPALDASRSLVDAVETKAMTTVATTSPALSAASDPVATDTAVSGPAPTPSEAAVDALSQPGRAPRVATPSALAAGPDRSSGRHRSPTIPSSPSGAGVFAHDAPNASAKRDSERSDVTPLPTAGAASSSAGGSGSFQILLAALAAALLLAAPGLSRRLRLGLASWPRPILQLSLERPG